MITRASKEKQVQALSESIKKAKAGFLVNFQGLNAQQITDMRKELKTQGDMKVCRNTLIKRALDSHPEIKEHLSSFLTGSNAFVLAFDEPARTAKLLSNYVKETEVLQIKAGMLEGKGISARDIKTLAELPSMEVLRAQFLSVLSAPMVKLLNVFSASPRGFLRVLASYKEKQQK